jgi:hypothetical protein
MLFTNEGEYLMIKTIFKDSKMGEEIATAE